MIKGVINVAGAQCSQDTLCQLSVVLLHWPIMLKERFFVVIIDVIIHCSSTVTPRSWPVLPLLHWTLSTQNTPSHSQCQLHTSLMGSQTNMPAIIQVSSYLTSPSGRRPGHQHWSCSDYAQSRHNYRYLYLLRALENCETVDGCSSACIRWIPKTGCYNGQGINIQQLPASEQAIQSWCTEYNKRPFHLLFFRRILTLSILTNRQICSYMKWDCHQPLAELWQIKTLVGRSIFTHAETYSSRGSTPGTETRFRLWHGDVK